MSEFRKWPTSNVTDSRKQSRERETMRKRRLVENIDTPLVRQDTISRDQVVYAYDCDQKTGGTKQPGKNVYLTTIRLD